MRYNQAILLIILLANNAFAGDIERGTFSVGVSSNAIFQNSRYTDDENAPRDHNEFEIALDMGYFFFKNFELGAGLEYHKFDGEEYGFSGYLATPYLAYHLPLKDKLNAFLQLGAGFGQSGNDSDRWKYTDTLIYGETGLEYFLNSNVALGLRFRWQHINWDTEGLLDEEVERLSTKINLKLYF
jgi:hypothetical protein